MVFCPCNIFLQGISFQQLSLIKLDKAFNLIEFEKYKDWLTYQNVCGSFKHINKADEIGMLLRCTRWQKGRVKNNLIKDRRVHKKEDL